MLLVFDGPWRVEYSQFYVSDAGPLLIGDSFAGQTNGLCGAADPGGLLCITGLHTGAVHVRVWLLDEQEGFAATGGDCVEVFCTVDGDWALLSFADEAMLPLPLPPGGYRVRYSAQQMDAGFHADLVRHGEPPVDRYELQFRPTETTSADDIIQVVSETAASWHAAARPGSPAAGRPQPAHTPKARPVSRSAIPVADELTGSGGGGPQASTTTGGKMRRWACHRARTSPRLPG